MPPPSDAKRKGRDHEIVAASRTTGHVPEHTGFASRPAHVTSAPGTAELEAAALSDETDALCTAYTPKRRVAGE
jgi:hypothetical protein